MCSNIMKDKKYHTFRTVQKSIKRNRYMFYKPNQSSRFHKIYTTDVTSGAGTTYFSGVHIRCLVGFVILAFSFLCSVLYIRVCLCPFSFGYFVVCPSFSLRSLTYLSLVQRLRSLESLTLVLRFLINLGL